jgi:hypothetical protein
MPPADNAGTVPASLFEAVQRVAFVGAGSPDPAPGPTAGLHKARETCGRARGRGRETVPQQGAAPPADGARAAAPRGLRRVSWDEFFGD